MLGPAAAPPKSLALSETSLTEGWFRNSRTSLLQRVG